MANEILILKNIPREGPGLIEDVLKDHNIKFDTIEPDQIQKIQSTDKLGALIVLGGPNSANDSDLRMKDELNLIRKVVNIKIPYLGICLGLQTLVKAMGGQVVKCHTKEVGFRNKDSEYYKNILSPQGKTDGLFKNIPDSFKVFQLHGETIQLSPQMTLLATGYTCKNQIVKIGDNAYGVQAHFELTMGMLDVWIKDDQDLQQLDSNQIRSDFEAIKDDYQRIGRQLFKNFLNIAGFLD